MLNCKIIYYTLLIVIAISFGVYGQQPEIVPVSLYQQSLTDSSNLVSITTVYSDQASFERRKSSLIVKPGDRLEFRLMSETESGEIVTIDCDTLKMRIIQAVAGQGIRGEDFEIESCKTRFLVPAYNDNVSGLYFIIKGRNSGAGDWLGGFYFGYRNK